MGADRTLWKMIMPTAQCDSSGRKVLVAVLVPTLCIRRPLNFYELMKKDNCGRGGHTAMGVIFSKVWGGSKQKAPSSALGSLHFSDCLQTGVADLL